LFGFYTQFLHSNIFTIQLILNSAKMRTTFTCFHLNSATVQKTGGNFAIFLHKLTGGMSVNKHTTLLKKSDMLNSHLPHLLLYSKPICHETPVLINTLLDELMKSDIRRQLSTPFTPNPHAMKPQFS
jgi:hypothetical protein